MRMRLNGIQDSEKNMKQFGDVEPRLRLVRGWCVAMLFLAVLEVGSGADAQLKVRYPIAGYGALHTLNLLFTKTVGNNSTEATRLNTAWQSRLLIPPLFEPGFEYYGQIDQIVNPGKPADQLHRSGPVLVSLQSFAPYGKLK